MPSKAEAQVVSSAPMVRLTSFQKLAHALVIVAFLAGPALATITLIPYMRDKRDKCEE